ncbi:helix-turn-helix domain-containing protein [Prevotella sp.]|uniref:helix-turn-helix domain-containing protein n=1 Tax=Prevotella sp. TaxID=59823 RepID=UPI002F94448F
MKTEFQQKIISRIKKIREENNCSQYALAKILSISPGQVGNIESLAQPHKYTLAQIRDICKEFHIQIEQLFFEDSDYRECVSIINLLIDKIIDYEQ